MRMQMTSKLGTVAIKVALVSFAAIGISVCALWIWVVFHYPGSFAKPNTFIIIETYSSSDRQTPTSRIYLEAPSSPGDLKFDGPSLRYRFAEVPHRQSSVPLKGVVLTGSGT